MTHLFRPRFGDARQIYDAVCDSIAAEADPLSLEYNQRVHALLVEASSRIAAKHAQPRVGRMDVLSARISGMGHIDALAHITIQLAAIAARSERMAGKRCDICRGARTVQTEAMACPSCLGEGVVPYSRSTTVMFK